MIYLFVLFTWIALGMFCSRIARQKNYHPVSWFVIGLLFGIIALLVIYLLPSRTKVKVFPATAPTPSQPSAFPLWYYLDRDNKQEGPISLCGLETAWIDDKITGSTYLWNEEMEEWKSLEDLPDIHARIRRAPPP